MKKFFFGLLLLFLLCPQGVLGRGMNTNELRQIAQAGGSLIVDLDKKSYSVTELAHIASALAHGATLTIRMSQGQLTVTQCMQLARAKPGQIKFWF